MGEDFEECLQGSFDECYQSTYTFPTTTATTATTTAITNTTTTTTTTTTATTNTTTATVAQYSSMQLEKYHLNQHPDRFCQRCSSAKLMAIGSASIAKAVVAVDDAKVIN